MGTGNVENRGRQIVGMLGGPTGSGKTAVALEVASALGLEILSCDSGQSRQGLAIGTAALLLPIHTNVHSQTPTTMETILSKSEAKNFDKPDEVRTFPKGRLELITIGGATIGRGIFEPGWRWSTSVMPIAKTKSCEAPHFQYHVSGILHVVMDDGTEYDLKPGDVSLLPSGHDAWTVGDEAAIVVDFQGMVDYATQNHKH